MKHRLFVYGTLRKGQLPTHKLPGYMMFAIPGKVFSFPVIQPYPWDDRQPDVYGNILEVDDQNLADFDHYEGVERGLYVRENVVVYPLVSGPAAPEIVQAYIGGPALVRQPIPSGVWE